MVGKAENIATQPSLAGAWAELGNTLYLGPYAFLNKNKGTFVRQTFHFLSESIFVFFIFGQKRQKIAVLNFRFFIKKS